jgi:adenylate cyclase
LFYLFEDFGLDTDRRELYRGATPVPVEPKVFDLLAYVIRNRDRVVSKDDLIAAIWNGRIVSESALTTCINAARNALGDSGEAQRLIRTLPRKGVRFIGNVREKAGEPLGVAPTHAVPGPSRPALALQDAITVAVLPFTNVSGDPEQEYFSDGLSEDIITDLSKVSTLAVTARNTSFALKGKVIDISQVARQLNVTHIVEGSVRKAGNRVRISAQLIDGQLGHHLWAERYDRDLDDIFVLQDEISHAIVDALKVKLAPAERANIGRRTTENVEAYQLYLMGRFYLRSQARHSYRMAADLFRRATEMDPKFARAWANLALAHSWLRTKGVSDVSLGTIEGFISTALRLDEDLAEAHAARAEVLLRHSDVTASEAASRRAIELDPTLHNGYFTLAEGFRRTNRFAEAVRAYEIAIPLDDQAWWSATEGSWCYEQLGDLDQARRLAKVAMKRLEQAIGFDPENATAYSVGCDVLRLLGQRDRAIEWASRAMEIDPSDSLAQYNCACFFFQIGESERAFGVLQRCAPHFSREQLNWMRRDPALDSVRDHPRYLALVQREEERWSRDTS